MSDELIEIAVEIDCKDVTNALEKLKAVLKSRTIIEGIGHSVQKWSRDRIRSRKNQAPDGSAWQSLAALGRWNSGESERKCSLSVLSVHVKINFAPLQQCSVKALWL